MKLMRKVLAVLFLGSLTAWGSTDLLQGHVLRWFAIENPSIHWVTQEDVTDVERVVTPSGHAVLRLHLKPDAAERVRALTAANVGKLVRFTWDGQTVSDLKIQGTFGERFDLPAPPT
jgi:preprotein translocase subunit SecD